MTSSASSSLVRQPVSIQMKYSNLAAASGSVVDEAKGCTFPKDPLPSSHSCPFGRRQIWMSAGDISQSDHGIAGKLNPGTSPLCPTPPSSIDLSNQCLFRALCKLLRAEIAPSLPPPPPSPLPTSSLSRIHIPDSTRTNHS